METYKFTLEISPDERVNLNVSAPSFMSEGQVIDYVNNNHEFRYQWVNLLYRRYGHKGVSFAVLMYDVDAVLTGLSDESPDISIDLSL